MFDRQGKMVFRAAATRSLTVACAGDYCPTHAEGLISAVGSGDILAEIQPWLDQAELRLLKASS